jgi:hypothetical protein
MADLTRIDASAAVEITDGVSQSCTIATATPLSSATGLVVREAARGQQTMAASIPVVLASDQSSISVTVSGTTTVTGTVTANAGTGTFTVADNQTIVDNAAFTDGTSKVFMGGYVFDETAGTALTENDAAAARVDSKRAQVFVIEDATTRGQRATVTAANAVKVDGSAVTQPVSGTVTANAGTGNFSTNIAQIAGSTVSTAATGIMKVGVTDSAGTSITVGQKTMANSFPVVISSDQSTLTVSGSGTFTVADNQVITDNAAFTDGTSKVFVAGYIFDETAGTALTENDAAAARVDSKRAQVFVMEDATTRGQRATVTAANAVKVDGSAVTQPVSGTVTANIGTTNGLALDSSVNALSLAQASTTSGQKGILGMGAVTTAAPTYTTAQTNPLSLTTAGALRVDGSAVTQPVSGTVTANAGTGTFNVTGTGTAGTAATGVITIQGIASMVAVKVDGSAVTQPVSGTVTANAGTGTFTVADNQAITDNAAFTDGTSKVFVAGYIFDETAGTALTENDAAAARVDSKRAQVFVMEDATTRGQRATVTAANAVKVDGSAVTQPVSGTVTANQGTAAAGSGAWPVTVTDTANTVVKPGDSANNAIRVNVVAGSSGGTSQTDQATFVAGSTAFTPVGGVFNDGLTALTSGQNATVRLTNNRAEHVNLRNASGTEIGTATTPLVVGGNVASGATDSGNPNKIGGVAHTAQPTAVTDGQRVDLITDKIGRLVTTYGHVRDLKTQNRISISSTTETTLLTAVASTFLDLTQIIITNTSTNKDATVDFRDSTGGTIRVSIRSNAQTTVAINFADILTQSTVNNNWTAQSDSATATLSITALAIKNI